MQEIYLMILFLLALFLWIKTLIIQVKSNKYVWFVFTLIIPILTIGFYIFNFKKLKLIFR